MLCSPLTLRKAFLICSLATLALGGCARVDKPAGTPAATAPATPPAAPLRIYAPASTSSIPVILAAHALSGTQLTLYTNQEQANTLFLRGEMDLLVTGLSVGVAMYRSEAPVQLANAYVSGLSYLLTAGKPVSRLAELKGQPIYLPFKGSPLEEVTTHLARQAGLNWPDDFRPVYLPFESSVELLKQGQAGAVVLPEPYVSLLEGQPNIYVSLSYYAEWQKLHPQAEGYPQVGTLVKADWAQAHAAQLAQFNQALAEALASVQQNPAAAVDMAKPNYKFPAKVLLTSLSHTHYHLLTGASLQQAVTDYYTIVEKPLDPNDAKFFYLAAR
jgi:NitT/TauT family transport system substrate-binding protein